MDGPCFATVALIGAHFRCSILAKYSETARPRAGAPPGRAESGWISRATSRSWALGSKPVWCSRITKSERAWKAAQTFWLARSELSDLKQDPTALGEARSSFQRAPRKRVLNQEPLPPADMLCIDYGLKRVGIAAGLGFAPRPLAVLERGKNDQDLVDQILELARARGVGRLVVGLALMKDGSEGVQANRCVAFARQLAVAAAPTPVLLWDERFSSVIAEEQLREAGRKAQARHQDIDAIAACQIMQEFYDASGVGAEIVSDKPGRSRRRRKDPLVEGAPAADDR
eukprot:tig00000498_g1636.t1